MFAVHGMRSLHTSVHFLRLWPCLTQKCPPRTFKEFTKLCSTSWPSLRITKPTRTVNSLYFINPPGTYYSTKPSRLSKDDVQLNRKIRLLKTVEEHLELFASDENSLDLVNKVTMLYSMAKITEREGKQKQVLEKEREKAQRGHSSAYVELLENISKDISQCKPKGLANLLWALGKIAEKDHELVQVCEKEILSRGIVAFTNAGICQVVNGCANLNLTASHIFQQLQDAILNQRQVNVKDFDNHGLSGILLSFSKTGNGSAELFDAFLEEILSRDFLMIGSRALAEFVWSFAKMKFNGDKLFDRVEEEILRRGTADFHNATFVQVLWAFSTVKKGSKELFNFIDSELVQRGVEKFSTYALLEIVWSFAKRNVKKAQVFDLVKKELLNRDVRKFQNHELVIILWSFVSAEKHDDVLVAEIEGELCSRDVKQFGNDLLCQVAWSLGKTGKSDSKLFDVIESEVFQRGASVFTRTQKYMLMRGFLQAKRGNKEFYKPLVSSFSASDFCNLSRGTICGFTWCFSREFVEAGMLFDALEKEILNKGKNYFTQYELDFIKFSFQKAGKGSKELFELQLGTQ